MADGLADEAQWRETPDAVGVGGVRCGCGATFFDGVTGSAYALAQLTCASCGDVVEVMAGG